MASSTKKPGVEKKLPELEEGTASYVDVCLRLQEMKKRMPAAKVLSKPSKEE